MEKIIKNINQNRFPFQKIDLDILPLGDKNDNINYPTKLNKNQTLSLNYLK